VALGQSVAAINRAQSELGAPPSLTGSFTGNAQAFQSSLASEPCWSRELYPPFYHPLDVAVRGSRGVAGIMGGGLRPVIGMIGIILLIGINRHDRDHPVDRDRQEERHHARTRYSVGLPAALSPGPDDHNGGDAWRHPADAWDRRGLGTSPAAWLCDGRRPRTQPASHLFTTPIIYLHLDRLHNRLASRRH
jgi:HAE1 family hydrophobic/amphiphilic exporter-1